MNSSSTGPSSLRAASADVMTTGSTTSARPTFVRFARNVSSVVASGSSYEPVWGSTAWTRAIARRAPAASHAVDRPFHDPISTMSPLPVVAAAASNNAQPCSSDNHPSIEAASGRTSSHVRIRSSLSLSAILRADDCGRSGAAARDDPLQEGRSKLAGFCHRLDHAKSCVGSLPPEGGSHGR